MATLNSSYQYIGRSNSIPAYARPYFYYVLLYAKTSGDPSTGKHTVSVKMRLACTADSTFYGYLTSGYAKVAGSDAFKWEWTRVPASSWGSGSITAGGVTYARYVDLKEGSVEIDTQYLSKNVTITASWQRHSIEGTPPNWLPSITVGKVSVDVTLPMIPSASTITSASDITLGNKCSVKWVPKSATFRYKLMFSIGDWSHTTGVIHPNQTSEYTYSGYSIPLDVANQVTDGPTGTMSVTLYSYSDSSASTLIGSEHTETFTVTVPDNASTKPVVSMSLSPVSSLPEAFDGLYIQGMTKVQATLSANGQYGADIDTYGMKVDEVLYGADASYTSDYLTTVGNRTVYGYATDKRTHTGETSQQINVIAYGSPKLEGVSVARCDENGNVSDIGTYLKITAKRSYSPVVSDGVQKNFCEIKFRYADSDVFGDDWHTILSRDSLESNEVSSGPLLDGAISAQSSYTVQVRAIDDVGRYSDAFITVPTAMVYWHRDGSRNALGLGKYNERDNAVDSNWDFYMNDHRITELADPVEDADAVTLGYLKQYIDSRLAALTNS